MIASLPMYDTAATRDANDLLWQETRRIYGRGPATLDRRQDPHTTWTSKELVLSQTCGLPYRQGLFRSVQLVGTPNYDLPNCPPGYYASALVVSENDPRRSIHEYREATLARNDIRSQSGWAAVTQHLKDSGADYAFRKQILDTGSHAASVQAVRTGKADIASIDAVTWALIQRDTDNAEGLRVLQFTKPTPGLPFITGQMEEADRLFDALREALRNLGKSVQERLMMKDIVFIPKEDYLAVPLPEPSHISTNNEPE